MNPQPASIPTPKLASREATQGVADGAPSTRCHPLPIKAFNLVSRALNRIGLGRVSLDEAELLQLAQRQTGLSDFGDMAFLEPLRVLLRALETEAGLNPFGRLHARSGIVDSLKNRLRAEACLRAHPEIRQRPIVAPIIIVGPVRSGTTRLHRLLAADPRLQFLTAWEGFNPAPWLDQPELGRTKRRGEVDKFLRVGQRLNPQAFAAHPMGTDEAEEEILLLNHAFCGLSASLLYDIPSRTRWLLQHDKRAAYRDMADMLRLIGWARGEAGNKRWVLKTPQHMLDLPALLAAFPDARLVFTHRDPVRTVASTMSLAWNFGVHNVDRPLRTIVRDTCLTLCEQMASRCIADRRHIAATQQLDVYYEDTNHDWRSQLQRILAFADLPWTADTEKAMAEWMDTSNREKRHAAHRYAAQDFGISPEDIDARLMFYRRQYAVPYERS